jgi:hypothetical protein
MAGYTPLLNPADVDAVGVKLEYTEHRTDDDQ